MQNHALPPSSVPISRKLDIKYNTVSGIFFMLFPPEQLQLILQLTNNELAMARKNYTTAGEIVKFFGVMLLVTWFEFGSQASLWSNMSTNKYIPAPSFGLTGMP